MITKAEILERAGRFGLQPHTVQKDYVIGWLLRAISGNETLSKWVFKGGTCLKKCYFETYRFSEDLDFTVPKDEKLSTAIIHDNLEAVTSWIESNSGLEFPRDDWKIEEYTNPRGNESFQAKISYFGPLGGARKSLPRVKFDITQDEIIVDSPVLRSVHHDYSDAIDPASQVLSYSINEILAEKSRAVYERNGRSRDIYDVVNISRNFRDQINTFRAKEIALEKFDYKGKPSPSVSLIVDAVDEEMLASTWENQLAHQISSLPPVESYISDLKDAVAWWLEPESALPALESMPRLWGAEVPRVAYPSVSGSSAMDKIRFAARNRLCAIVNYHGSERIVEPYSLRHPATGNEILHVWELEKDGISSGDGEHKSFKVHEIESAEVSQQTFVPQWEIEL